MSISTVGARAVKGKTAIITGAGSGINFEFAKILLEKGCNVVIGDIALRPEAEKLVKQYSESTSKAVYCKTDATSWKDLNALFKAAEDQFGTFDIVCPGAGIFEPTFSGFWYPPGSESSKDAVEGDRYMQIDLNLVHPIRSTQLAISHFLTEESKATVDSPKTIVHIASIAAEGAFAPVAIYNATKWGLRGFIYAMGELEATRNIRVSGVAPAIVRTPLWLEADDKKKVVSNTEGQEQNDWVTPEEVAEVMYKICTEDQLTTSTGEVVSTKGGSLIEVGHNDVRDVPMFGNSAPGTGTQGKGYALASGEQMWAGMNASLSKPGWGRLP